MARNAKKLRRKFLLAKGVDRKRAIDFELSFGSIVRATREGTGKIDGLLADCNIRYQA
jgi:hypothetical protein